MSNESLRKCLCLLYKLDKIEVIFFCGFKIELVKFSFKVLVDMNCFMVLDFI